MYGWNGKLLRVDLTKGKATSKKYDFSFANKYLGGRGFAIKLLWDELETGTGSLSPDNLLILAAGPLTAFPLPSSGKLVVAAKSPLTGGYGDGNLGTNLTVQMRRAGFDAIVIKGKASQSMVLYVENDEIEFVNGEEYWGMGTFQSEERLKKNFSLNCGVVTIGPAGENLVRYANVISQKGRAGGRPGIGAVMGSKNLKAIVIRGEKPIPAADFTALKTLGMDAYREILEKPNYKFWKRQGTMATLEWSNENNVLPTQNFRDGVFDEADKIGGFAMENLKTSNRGCPHCNMTCGNVIPDSESSFSELDYENVAMLGSNLGIGDLKRIATLNRLADDYGIDTISLGNAIGFAMEASEKGLLKRKIEWGDFQDAKLLAEDIIYRRDVGATLADGIRTAAEKIGGDARDWAMQIKGLEVSGYDCHTTPGMALSYATCTIGAHHKDAWVISWEVSVGRHNYDETKVDKVIELQRLRGGLFECLTTCRLPWVEVNFDLTWYSKFMKAATGKSFTMNDFFVVSDRIVTLIRAFWIRESNGNWNRAMDTPPSRWFKDPLTEGPFTGATLDLEQFMGMLNLYYEKRGWDKQGIPTKSTLVTLGLNEVIPVLNQHTQLQD